MSTDHAPVPVPPNDPGPTTTREGVIFYWIHAIGRLLTSLSPNQFLLVMVLTLMFFVCGMYGWSSYNNSKQAVEMHNAEMRATAEREELMRQNCSFERDKERLYAAQERDRDRIEAEKVRQFFANQAELQRRHDDEREEKSRVVVSAMVAQMARLELAYLKGKSP